MKNLLKLLLVICLTACASSKTPVEVEIPLQPKKVFLSDIYHPYSYTATVIDVYDGDTFTLDFEIGFNLRFEDVVRLARVDTPEIRGKERQEGLKVRDQVEKLILLKRIIAITEKDERGKYGRLITEIYYQDGGNWINLSNYLLEKGMAELY